VGLGGSLSLAGRFSCKSTLPHAASFARTPTRAVPFGGHNFYKEKAARASVSVFP
jgi:hypothetical protein